MGNMVLEQCDLSAASFDNINIYAGLDLKSCRLPSSGIRVFRNPRGAFSRSLREAAALLDRDTGIPLNVLGNEACYADQNPVVFDLPGLKQVLDAALARERFEAISEEFEITQRLNSAHP